MDTYRTTEHLSTQEPALLPQNPLETLAEQAPAMPGERWNAPNDWNAITPDGGTYLMPAHTDVDTDNYPNF